MDYARTSEMHVQFSDCVSHANAEGEKNSRTFVWIRDVDKLDILQKPGFLCLIILALQ